MKKPWQDRDYLKKLCLSKLGLEEHQIPKRYLRLLMKIEASKQQLSDYCFQNAYHRIYDCQIEFIKELRNLK